MERRGVSVRGLYVHVPFCVRACPYCDFDFEVSRQPDLGLYLEGLRREADHRGVTGAFETVYVGGGTPSALGAEGLGALCTWIRARFSGHDGLEWTVELNPEHVDARLLARLAEVGVNRVSLGVQTFDDSGLRQLGRVHDNRMAQDAVTAAVAAGFRVSVDLIVGWPGQARSTLARDIATVLELDVTHVSVYALTVEAGTPWEALVRRGQRHLPQASVQASRLEQAAQRLGAAGFDHYEVASYGRDGHRALHNMIYWSWKDYVGLGPSAHSATYRGDGSVTRRGNRRGLARWTGDSVAPEHEERLGPEDAAAEGLWLGLRRLEGMSARSFLDRFRAVDQAWLDRRLERPVELGRVEVRGDRIRVAGDRWLIHDRICADLL